MPVFNFFHWTEKHGFTLAETGPLVAVEIAIPAALKAHLAEKALPIPPAKSGFALIDTGAFATAVDEQVFKDLGVSPIDSLETNTPHGKGTSSIYPASVSFPGLAVRELKMERVVGCNLMWKTRDDKEILMLLGRDLLSHFVLIYNGVNSDITLCF
jgi:hypothetical protein